MPRQRRFDFVGEEESRFTITVSMESLREGRQLVRGPFGEEYTLEVRGVPEEHREAATRLLSEDEQQRELDEREADALSEARAVLSTGEAAAPGPIVRFDCKWVRID